MELRQQQYTRHWKTDLTNATCASPGCERVVMSRGATKAACARLRCPHHATHATHARCQEGLLAGELACILMGGVMQSVVAPPIDHRPRCAPCSLLRVGLLQLVRVVPPEEALLARRHVPIPVLQR